jgi:AcrR family transcriptional regulator
LSGAKAARIIDAMRASVAVLGAAGSTFDRVASQAGVSRGLLHYYFGSKERLLIEVVRRECDVRTERLEAAIAAAEDAEDVLDALVRSFEDLIGDGQAAPVMICEMLTLGRRNEEIAAELAKLGRQTRAHLAGALERKHEAGVLGLRIGPELAAMFLFALSDGVMFRRLSEPELDITALVEQGIVAARAVLS